MTDPHQRTASSGADLRLLRTTVFAAVCVVLAAAGHTLASCATVPLWTLGAGFLGVAAVVVPFAGRARSLPGVAALLAAGQVLLHTLFGLAQHTTGAAGPAPSSDATLVARAARLLCGTTAAALSPAQARRILMDARVYDGSGPAAVNGSGAGGSGMGGMSGMGHAADAVSSGATGSLLPSLSMVLAHVLAAVAAGWLLRRGDLAVLRLLDLSRHELTEGALVRSLRGALALVRALLAGLPDTPEPRVARTALFAPPPKPPTAALQHAVIRRGPPAAARLALAA